MFFLKVACPNITGAVEVPWAWQDEATVLENPEGVFYNPTGHHAWLANLNRIKSDQRHDSVDGIWFDASKSNAIYSKSSTVQPPSLILNYIIKY